MAETNMKKTEWTGTEFSYNNIMQMSPEELEEAFATLVANLKPASEEWAQACLAHWNGVAKPLGGLGKLEDLIIQIGAIRGREDVSVAKRCVAVFCADNGVVAEGISQSGQEVTAIIARLAAGGNSSVSAMAKASGTHTIPVDMGVHADLTDVENLRQYKVMPGTRNLAKEPAMSRQQALQAILIGAGLAMECAALGYDIMAVGEGGIGNTTTSAAVAAALLQVPAAQTAGKGAGLSDAGLQHKIEVIDGAIALHRPNPADPVDVLAKVGGLDIAAMCGFYLGGACSGVPVVIDGVIGAVAALCACRIHPVAKESMLPSHLSAEPAAAMIMEELQLSPILQGNFHLGEGTGAVALFPLLDLALAVYRQNTSFASIGMEAYQPL